ncbi:MAG: glycosyltransferase family 4 protein [Acidimicrobiales bacterium]
MRIIVFNWRDMAHPLAGGAEVYTHSVTREWVDQGHDVTLFCAAVDGAPSEEVTDGVRTVRRGGRHSVYTQARRFYVAERSGTYDLVVDEVNTRPFGCPRWAGTTRVAALVHQVAREVWHQETATPVALLGRYVLEPRWLAAYRDVPVMTVSESSRASLAEYGLSNITVVPEGFTEPPEFAGLNGARPLREGRPTLVWAGRLARNKRPLDALEAFKRVREELPDAQLWVIGSGPMEHLLRAAAPDGTTFFGRVPEVEKYRLFARAHALIATSVREGWGLTVTEAASVGTPAIAYNVPGLTDSVTASKGCIVHPSPSALAKKIVELVPAWVNGVMPDVIPGGVLPWKDVASLLLEGMLSDRSAEQRTRSKAGRVRTARTTGDLAGTPVRPNRTLR